MSTPHETPKKKRRWLRRTICAILVLLLVYVFCFREVPLRIAPETTVLTEPLTADAKRVDYFSAIEAINKPSVPPEQNGFRRVAQAAGRVQFENIGMDYWTKFCKKLNLDPHEPAGFPYYKATKILYEAANKELEITTPLMDAERIKNRPPEMPEDAMYLWNRDAHAIQWVNDRMEKAREKAWTGEDDPLMEQYILDISPFLDLVAQAVREDVYYIPIVQRRENDTIDETLIPCIQSHREFARDLNRRAYYYLGKGEKDKAIDDLITIFRLGQHLKSDIFLITRFVGSAVELIGYLPLADLLQNYDLNREQYEKILAELSQLPKASPVEIHYLSEHYAMLDVVSSLSQKKYRFNMFIGEIVYSDSYSPKLAWLNYFGYDWNDVAKRANRLYQQNLDVMKESDIEKRKKKQQNLFAELQGIKNRRENLFSYWRMLFVRTRSQLMGDAIGAYFCSVLNEYEHPNGRLYYGDACVELSRLACALELYKFDEGRYPDRLGKLCDKYLKTLPDDPCADVKQPFRYRLAERSVSEGGQVGYGYLLYSVGTNGVDSDGKTNLKINGLEDLYDSTDKHANFPIRK